MTKNFLTIFILVAIAFGTFAEVDAQHSTSSSDQIESVSGQVSANLNLSSSEDECHDKECNDSEGHCAHHCSGIHNAALNTITIKISTSVGQASKLLWYYSNKYQTLDIDTALRPPTYS